ncbi:MAG: glycosyltransferase family 4 protein [Treponema sp.]|nr:glycosyltransferase family 4 protein [Treponema sp.]
MQKRILINGEAWCHNLTGIERVAIDTVSALDGIAEPGFLELVLPRNARSVPSYRNIAVTVLGVDATFFPRWTNGAFQRHVLARRGTSLSFSNTCPYATPGIAYLHDIYARLHPEDYTSRRDRLIRLYSNAMYRRIAKSAKAVVAVSEYTKRTIVEAYHVPEERVTVIPNGLSPSYRALPPDYGIFRKFPVLEEGPFYFCLGSLSVRKNLRWVADHAEMFPSERFVVSGKALLNHVVPPELEKLRTLGNVTMTGYVSDAEVKALMSRCRAFIHPSYFEGFGLPPLEALSCGAPVVVADRTSLPEIYGGAAHYLDPDDPALDLDAVLAEPVESPARLLETYTAENSARALYRLLRDTPA